MNNKFKDLQDWFTNYSESFCCDNEGLTRNIRLKQIHTVHVCKDISLIAGSLTLDREWKDITEIAALFHDIGRFKQVAVYGTFEDGKSENHGALGFKILKEMDILRYLPNNQIELILTAVKFHNVLTLPKYLNIDGYDDARFLLKMLRDADKLDIWRIILEIFDQPMNERPSAAGLGLPSSDGYSSEAINNIFNKNIVYLSQLKCQNDMKLMQLSWIFDLNFRETFRLMLERDYINKIINNLPNTKEIKELNVFLYEYVNQRLSNKDMV